MEDTHTSKPKVSARKRRGGTKKVDRIIDDDTPPALTKDELRAKLRDKLRLKQTIRLSRASRETIIDKLESKMKNAKGKEKMKLKKQMKELEAVDDQEMNNEGGRTIPEYD
jgi:hypothetical protein